MLNKLTAELFRTSSPPNKGGRSRGARQWGCGGDATHGGELLPAAHEWLGPGTPENLLNWKMVESNCLGSKLTFLGTDLLGYDPFGFRLDGSPFLICKCITTWLMKKPSLKAVQMNKNPFGLAPSGPLQLNVVRGRQKPTVFRLSNSRDFLVRLFVLMFPFQSHHIPKHIAFIRFHIELFFIA